MDEIKKLKKHLMELLSQFEKQDNPVILREISLAAFRLMKAEKGMLLCCPKCGEAALLDTFNEPRGEVIQVFHTQSQLKCENKHTWRHTWKVADKILHYEPVNQYYVYQCDKIVSDYNIQFKRVNGVRHFPDRRWNNDRRAYDN